MGELDEKMQEMEATMAQMEGEMAAVEAQAAAQMQAQRAQLAAEGYAIERPAAPPTLAESQAALAALISQLPADRPEQAVPLPCCACGGRPTAGRTNRGAAAETSAIPRLTTRFNGTCFRGRSPIRRRASRGATGPGPSRLSRQSV